jgi:predicted TIM-barrel fold metal-dependent hydrolase
MPQAQRLISTVDYVVEHPEVWTWRLSKSRWGDRIPHIEYSSQEGDAWVVDGRRLPLSECAQVGAVMTDRADTPKRWEDIPPSAYLPAERLKAMDTDGVAYSVLYPTLAGSSGEKFGALADPELALACVQAYNDWLADEWAGASQRFIPQCLAPIWPVEVAVAEIQRCVRQGHKGVVFPAVPMHLRDVPHINSPEYDPIWMTCQDLDVPLCFHAGSSTQLQFPVAPALSPELAAAMRAVTRTASAVFDLVNLLFSRILLRFPRLKVIFAESTIGWGTFLLEYADHQYGQDHCDYELKPSEMFRRQCYLTTWYDPVKMNARHIGIKNILWATNFPSANSAWPDSQNFIGKCIAGMSDTERHQILWENAARLYKLERVK